MWQPPAVAVATKKELAGLHTVVENNDLARHAVFLAKARRVSSISSELSSTNRMYGFIDSFLTNAKSRCRFQSTRHALQLRANTL